MDENLKHFETFEYYYSLGSARSCSQVAENFNISERTVYNWSKWFKWKQRIKDRDINNAKKLEEKTDTTLLETKTKYLVVIQATLYQYMKSLKSGNIRVNSVTDLEKLAKLELFLRDGEVSTGSNIVNITIEQDDQC